MTNTAMTYDICLSVVSKQAQPHRLTASP